MESDNHRLRQFASARDATKALRSEGTYKKGEFRSQGEESQMYGRIDIDDKEKKLIKGKVGERTKHN